MKEKKFAPEILRQRLLIEGYFSIDVDEETIRQYFSGITNKLSLKTYGEPIIFSPSSGMGKEENAGYDAFVPLIDSGIALYVWTKAKFFSVVIYTCKEFEDNIAIDFSRNFFEVKEDMLMKSF